MKEAEIQKDYNLIRMWYPIVPLIFADDEKEKFINNNYIKLTRDSVIRTNAYTISNDYGCMRLPDENTLTDLSQSSKFDAWWFEPLKSYYRTKENNSVYWLNESSKLVKELRSMANVMKKILVEKLNIKIDENAIQKNLNHAYQKVLQTINKGLSIEINAGFYINEGITHEIMGKYEDSIKSYKKALALSPNNDTIYAYLGYAYHKQDKWNLAKENYQKALEINENNEFAKYYIKKKN